jgi:hypothetical protein
MFPNLAGERAEAEIEVRQERLVVIRFSFCNAHQYTGIAGMGTVLRTACRSSDYFLVFRLVYELDN